MLARPIRTDYENKLNGEKARNKDTEKTRFGLVLDTYKHRHSQGSVSIVCLLYNSHFYGYES